MLVGRNRLWIGLAALALLACLGPGCDSTQPTDASGGNGNAVVEFTATASVNIDDVYDFFVDGNHCAINCTLDAECTETTEHRCVGNICVVPCTSTANCLFGQTCDLVSGTCRPVSAVQCETTCSAGQTCVQEKDNLPDDVSQPPDGVPDLFQVCVPSGGVRDALVPLNYWVDVKKVPAGSTEQVQISDPALFNAPTAITGFSTNPIETGVSPARPAFDTDPSHVYANPRRMDESRAELIAMPPLREGDPGVPFIGIGGATNPPQNVYCPYGFTLSTLSTFTTDLQTGDTLLVKAKKLSPPALVFLSEPRFIGRVLLNGVEQSPVGTTEVSAAGGDLAFSFTVR